MLEGGPWSFEQNMLVYTRVNGAEEANAVNLNEMDIWAQVYDLPSGFVSENIMRSIGTYIGRYVKTDPSSLDGMWKPYVRIRVKLDIEKPLKRRMKIKREGGDWVWINFKYECLGNFCFVCGILGHVERDCNLVYANPDKQMEKAYGTWLRALNRNAKNNTGARWLRNVDGGGGGVEVDGGRRNSGMGSGSMGMKARFSGGSGCHARKRG